MPTAQTGKSAFGSRVSIGTRGALKSGSRTTGSFAWGSGPGGLAGAGSGGVGGPVKPAQGVKVVAHRVALRGADFNGIVHNASHHADEAFDINPRPHSAAGEFGIGHQVGNESDRKLGFGIGHAVLNG
jgi:hypothetical protein